MQISSQSSLHLNPKHLLNFPTVITDSLHNAGVGRITLIRENITFTTTDIPSTINTHNTELPKVKAHINNTKHIAIANMYIPPPPDSTSTQYKTADTYIQHCIQYITHSVLTGDWNAHYSQTLSNTQHTRQTYPLTEQHIKYKDIILYSPQLRSKRQ